MASKHSPGVLAFTAGLAALLSACAWQPRIDNTYYSSYSPGMLSYAASKGGMKTEIIGAPVTAGERTEFAEFVTRRLAEGSPGPVMPFFTDAPADFTSPYRVVLLFDPAPGVGADDLCSRPDLESRAKGATLDVAAAFCSSQTAVTRVSGSMGRVDSLSDPAFGRLLTQVARGLFPATANIDRTDGSGDFDQ